MLSDYKSLKDRDIFSRRQPHKRLYLLILGFLPLTATAIYGSLQIFSSTETASEAKAPEPALIKTSLGSAQERGFRTIPLQLPSLPHTESEQPMAASLQIQSSTEEVARPVTTPEGNDTDTIQEPAEIIGHWKEEKVREGDSLAKIFTRLNLSANLLHRITHSSPEAKKLAKIRPGQTLRVHLDDASELLELVLQRTPVESVHVIPDGKTFTTRVNVKQLETRTSHATGIITNSLYESALEAGLPETLIMDLANIFGWDIDFALEIREGDSFSLIYEENYLEGEKYGNGAILAAEFVNRGKSFRAVRYEDDTGHAEYFSPDGKSMRKSFLRAPVDFRRISSRFTRERYHPVLGKKRPHRGVDYAAATGTPVKASGDGKVIFRGTKGGYGRTVIIQHANQYTTLYAHLSKYRGSVKKGSRVKQGQVIGYVGKSGLATGPHLHYEFRVNGVHRNPLTVQLPAASPIAKKYKADFIEKSALLLARLDLISRTLLADAR